MAHFAFLRELCVLPVRLFIRGASCLLFQRPTNNSVTKLTLRVNGDVDKLQSAFVKEISQFRLI